MRRAVVSLLCWLAIGRAQNIPTTGAVCAAEYSWASNDRGQSPCLLAAYIQGACGSGYWNVPALPLGNRYDPPRANQTNRCLCSSVTYSALSACGACQRSSWVTWPAWKANCSPEQVSLAAYVVDIPKDTSIPRWAYTDPTLSMSSSFNVSLAREIAALDLPDVVVANVTTSTTSVSSNPTSSPLPTSTGDAPSSGSNPNAGLIAGATIGSVAVLTLIAALIFVAWRMRRSSRASAAPSNQYINKWSKNIGRGAPPSSWGGSVYGGDRDTPITQSTAPGISMSQTSNPYHSLPPPTQFPSPPAPDGNFRAISPSRRKAGSHNQNVITPFVLPPRSDVAPHYPSGGSIQYRGSSLDSSTLPSDQLTGGDTHSALPSYMPSNTLSTPPYTTPPQYDYHGHPRAFADEKRRSHDGSITSSAPVPPGAMNPVRVSNPDELDGRNGRRIGGVSFLDSSTLYSAPVGNLTNNNVPYHPSNHSRLPSTEYISSGNQKAPPSAWDAKASISSLPVINASAVHRPPSLSSSDMTSPLHSTRSNDPSSMSYVPLLSRPARTKQPSQDSLMTQSSNIKGGAAEEEFNPWNLINR